MTRPLIPLPAHGSDTRRVLERVADDEIVTWGDVPKAARCALYRYTEATRCLPSDLVTISDDRRQQVLRARKRRQLWQTTR